MKYIAWVRYGTSKSGNNDYMQYVDGKYDIFNGRHNIAVFNSLEEAKQIVNEWCVTKRAQLASALFPITSGKAFNQTRPGAWHYQPYDEYLAEENKVQTMIRSVLK